MPSLNITKTLPTPAGLQLMQHTWRPTRSGCFCYREAKTGVERSAWLPSDSCEKLKTTTSVMSRLWDRPWYQSSSRGRQPYWSHMTQVQTGTTSVKTIGRSWAHCSSGYQLERLEWLTPTLAKENMSLHSHFPNSPRKQQKQTHSRMFQLCLSVRNTADDGNVSIFTKDSVSVYKEQDVLIACKGTAILAGKRDARRQ
jgi:hypothetical protein